MNEWIEAVNELPPDNSKVLIMLMDATGCNAIYKDGIFISEKDSKDRWLPKDVKFWKKRAGLEDYNQQVKKKCGMCGRFR